MNKKKVKKKVKCGVGQLLDPKTGKCRKMTGREKKGVAMFTYGGAVTGGALAGPVGAAVGGYLGRKKSRKAFREGRID